jgi:hypothetical protein
MKAMINDLPIKEQKELSAIISTTQKLHKQLQKSSYFMKEQTYTINEEGDQIPDDILLEILPNLNVWCVEVIRQFVKQLED